jgi:hypothetical protein
MYNAAMPDANENRQEHQVQLSFPELVPPEWITEENSWLWIACYHSMRIKKEHLAERLRTIELSDARVVLFYGSPRYQPPPTLTAIQSTYPPAFHLSVTEQSVGMEGAYAMMILRYQPPAETEYDARVRELALRSLLGTVLGENLVYHRLYHYPIRVDKSEAQLYGEPLRNPLSDPEPDISDEGLKKVTELYAAIDVLEEHQRNRVRLSLRWHGEARDGAGVESFVNEWVALEALGMTAQKNVAPLEEALAQAYGISTAEANKRFQVRSLFSFRSQILHQGHIPGIHSDLMDYLRALYKDILWQRVGFPSERVAEAVLLRPGFDLKPLLKLSK